MVVGGAVGCVGAAQAFGPHIQWCCCCPCRQGNATAGAKEGALEAEAAAGSSGSGSSSRRSRRRSVLTGTLFTVAVAIISMIIFKRARLVRIVRT